MFLESGRAISEKLDELLESQACGSPVLIAVAFWGSGAAEFLERGKPLKIICNLGAGGTNPDVIQKLRALSDVEIRVSNKLHAKVVLGTEGAIVGSANFSSDGLGLSGHETGWQEAGYFVEVSNTEFDRINGWFWDLWLSSKVVTNEDIRSAFSLWEARKSGSQTSNQPGVTDSTDQYELRENELFEPAINGKNKIRMASVKLVNLYSTIEPINKYNTRIPAYVSYLLWTVSGREMETAIKDTPVFSMPEQVLSRARDMSKKNPAKMRALLHLLADTDQVTESVRYWANKAISQGILSDQ